MLLKRLAMKNIRSYKDAEVEFPGGILLFSGDIGTGKSTILYAIELALFGPAEGETRKKKDFYLRGDEKEGWVRLDVEVAKTEYSFHRELNRTGSGKCKILVDGGFTEYAPSEMRRRVLDILGFNEPPGARASSVIYRYAVFTPQEEMKEILRMKEDDRIQTLRKAFRIEEYKIARENADIAARHFRSRSSQLDDLARDLDALRETLREREAARERLALELARNEQELEMVSAGFEKLETEVMELERTRERRERLAHEAGRHRETLRQLSEWLSDAEKQAAALRLAEQGLETLRPRVERDREFAKRLDGLEQELDERHTLSRKLAVLQQKLEDTQEKLDRMEGRQKRMHAIRRRLEELAPEVEQVASVEGSLERNLKDEMKLSGRLETTESKTEELEVEKRGFKGLEKGRQCPKCGQELSLAHLEKVLGDIDKKLGASALENGKLSQKLKERQKAVQDCQKRLAELKDCLSEQRKLESELKHLEQELSEKAGLEKAREHIQKDIDKLEDSLRDKTAEKEAQRLRALRPEWEARRGELSRLEERSAMLLQNEKQIAQRQNELEVAKNEVEKAQTELAQMDADYNEGAHRAKKQERDRLFSRMGFLKGTVGEHGRRREDNAIEIGRVAAALRDKEGRLAELARFREGAAWLSEFFGPALESIERHVLSHINYQFDELFRKWFGMLVEGTELDVTIDENFTPVVNQGGYELDLWSLSGGEKTSVALAYRLALNHMVKEVSSVDQGNLLILDEPTDGFSTEQLSKVRDVLRELRAPQLIIVSHERELESFADHVFRVVKENGASRVESLRG